MCFYMSMLTLADTGKYITEGCLNMFLHVYVWLWQIQVNKKLLTLMFKKVFVYFSKDKFVYRIIF